MNFEQWWPCPKKHTKRMNHLMPHVKQIKAHISATRPFRYFTLCAPSMIDVFMLAKEGILDYDDVRKAIDTVVFCEFNQEVVPMMRELVGRENAGFQGQLEELILFDDDIFTAAVPDLRAIESYITRKGESLTEDQRNRLRLKSDHLELQKCFPFDFINLDFCDHYYPQPPDILKVNRTVDRMLDWQHRVVGTDSSGAMRVEEFMMAITCRHDERLPAEAQDRLINLVRSNCDEFPQYKAQLRELHPDDLEEWARSANLDFFLASWPKEIGRLAQERRWNMEIADYVHYSRINDAGKQYEIVCLVCIFRRTDLSTTYLDVAMKALDENQRVEIVSVDLNAAGGKALLLDLTSIVNLRNSHAEHSNREKLPLPKDAIAAFEAQGIRY